jgi:hypothetical protein
VTSKMAIAFVDCRAPPLPEKARIRQTLQSEKFAKTLIRCLGAGAAVHTSLRLDCRVIPPDMSRDHRPAATASASDIIPVSDICSHRREHVRRLGMGRWHRPERRQTRFGALTVRRRQKQQSEAPNGNTVGRYLPALSALEDISNAVEIMPIRSSRLGAEW